MNLDVGGLARAGLNSLPGVQLAPPAGELPSASALDNARLNAFVVVPNAVQGIFRRRRRAVAAATRADIDRWAVGLLEGMRRTHAGKPIWVRLGPSRALMLLSVDDVRATLEGSPDPFAADPEAKRKGMVHFQPEALTISRNPQWAERRDFTETVLETGRAAHRLADPFAAVIATETKALLDQVGGGELDWDAWALALRRITRRIVLGDLARDDEGLTDQLFAMMDAANSMPGEPSDQLGEFRARLKAHIERAEPGSLAALVAEAPKGESVDPAAQFTHWLFAMGDTLPVNAFRALAAIASHPVENDRVAGEIEDAGELVGAAIASLHRLGGCLHEAMRLWPSTPMLSRELLADATLGGVSIPAGTQVLIINTYMHRDRDRHPDADAFRPGAWVNGTAGEDWSFNHLSHGPQGCPGSDLVLFVGGGILANLLRARDVSVLDGAMDPGRPLPHMLDAFALRFRLEPGN